ELDRIHDRRDDNRRVLGCVPRGGGHRCRRGEEDVDFRVRKLARKWLGGVPVVGRGATQDLEVPTLDVAFLAEALDETLERRLVVRAGILPAEVTDFRHAILRGDISSNQHPARNGKHYPHRLTPCWMTSSARSGSGWGRRFRHGFRLRFS